MTRYLVVAYQTACSQELVDCLQGLARTSAGCEFTLLVPATPVRHLLSWEEGAAETLARHRADEAAQVLGAAGLCVAGAHVGQASPLAAIERRLATDELPYDGIVIATFPRRLSRWLERDLPRRAEQRFGLPTVHVVASPHTAGAGASNADAEAAPPDEGLGLAERRFYEAGA